MNPKWIENYTRKSKMFFKKYIFLINFFWMGQTRNKIRLELTQIKHKPPYIRLD
jgi:hypothetical protein